MKLQTTTGLDLNLNGTLDYLQIKSEADVNQTIYYKDIKKVKTNLPDNLDEMIIRKEDKKFSANLFFVFFIIAAFVFGYNMTKSTSSTGRYTLFQNDYDKAVSGYSLGYEKNENYTNTYRWISGVLGFIFLLVYISDRKEFKKMKLKVDESNSKILINHSYELYLLSYKDGNLGVINGNALELISISKTIRNNIKLYNSRESKKRELAKKKK